ncbi:FMRFamide receptor-like [Littorina saxatilis]|uniref:FMRFamide receptor-like n=1 Tax=Littorina saxatilis TaxID=31220 RepID=UPI0038B4F7A9
MASPRLNLYVFFLLFAQFGHVGNTPLDSTSENLVPSTATFDSYQVNTTVLSRQHQETTRLDFALRAYVIPSIAALGLCGNVLTLVVWSAELLFNPATFFMKALAVSDTIFIVSALCHWHPFLKTLGNRNLTGTVVVYSRAVSAYTTMVIVFTRWLAVHTPMRVRSLLTKRNVVLSYVLALLWCSLILIPFFLQLWKVTSWNTDLYTTFNISDGVCVGLPIVVMVFLNISLVNKMCGHRATSGLGQPSPASVTARSSRFHGLLAAVVCLSVTTILAYPLGFIVRVLNTHSSSMIIDVLNVVMGVLEVVNASINVVYYLLFASQFRQLLRKRFEYGVQCDGVCISVLGRECHCKGHWQAEQADKESEFYCRPEP